MQPIQLFCVTDTLTYCCFCDIKVVPGLGGVCASVVAEAGESVTASVNLQQLWIRVCLQLPWGISAGSTTEQVVNNKRSSSFSKFKEHQVSSRIDDCVTSLGWIFPSSASPPGRFPCCYREYIWRRTGLHCRPDADTQNHTGKNVLTYYMYTPVHPDRTFKSETKSTWY